MDSVICLQTRPRVIYTKKNSEQVWFSVVCRYSQDDLASECIGFDESSSYWWGSWALPTYLPLVIAALFCCKPSWKSFLTSGRSWKSLPKTIPASIYASPPHQQRGNAQLDNMLFKEVLPWLLPQKSLINDWAQIAPKNIINQPGNREVEGRLERKIGAGINFIATLKMIIFPTTPYLASRSICVRFEGQIHIADRNEKTSFDSPYDYGVVFFSQEKNKPSEEVIQWNGGTFIENIKGGQHWTAQEIEAYRFSFSIVDWYQSLGYIYSV